MTIESAMDRIEAADDSPAEADDREQKYEMYRKSLRALEDLTPEDNDEGITVVASWIVEKIETTGQLPSSKAVRRRAREFCRDNGHEISDDSWLGT